MSDISPIALTATGVLMAAVLLAIFYIAVAWKHINHDRERDDDLRMATSIVASALADPFQRSTAVKAVSQLKWRQQAELIERLVPTVGGSNADWLSSIADVSDLAAKAENLCHSRFWWRRVYGIRLLGMLRRNNPVVRLLFYDRNNWVRVEAVRWAGIVKDERSITGLLNRIGDEDSLMRRTASDAMLSFGNPVVKPLCDFLMTRHGKALVEALIIAEAMGDSRFHAPALNLSNDPSDQVRRKAIAVLGRIGGEEATTVLLDRVGDKNPGVRTEAARALGRLNHWPGAPKVAELLGDVHWEPRRASAEALMSMGHPGTLMLKQSASSNNELASDTANYVLAAGRFSERTMG